VVNTNTQAQVNSFKIFLEFFVRAARASGVAPCKLGSFWIFQKVEMVQIINVLEGIRIFSIGFV